MIIAEDVNPAEITMHLPLLAKEKDVPCVSVPKKEDLGAACGLGIAAVSVVITEPGDAASFIAELATEMKANDESEVKADDKKPSEEKATPVQNEKDKQKEENDEKAE